jgi:hypothetical protein
MDELAGAVAAGTLRPSLAAAALVGAVVAVGTVGALARWLTTRSGDRAGPPGPVVGAVVVVGAYAAGRGGGGALVRSALGVDGPVAALATLPLATAAVGLCLFLAYLGGWRSFRDPRGVARHRARPYAVQGSLAAPVVLSLELVVRLAPATPAPAVAAVVFLGVTAVGVVGTPAGALLSGRVRAPTDRERDRVAAAADRAGVDVGDLAVVAADRPLVVRVPVVDRTYVSTAVLGEADLAAALAVETAATARGVGLARASADGALATTLLAGTVACARVGVDAAAVRTVAPQSVVVLAGGTVALAVLTAGVRRAVRRLAYAADRDAALRVGADRVADAHRLLAEDVDSRVARLLGAVPTPAARREALGTTAFATRRGSGGPAGD